MLGRVIGYHMIRYTTLTEKLHLIPPNLTDDEKHIILYIDLSHIIDRLYRGTSPTIIMNNGENSIITIFSGLVNIVAHYRQYFSSMGYSNKIIFLYNRELPTYQNSMVSFGIDYYTPKNNITTSVLNNTINKVLNMFRDVCNYIPNCYFPKHDKIEVYNMIQYYYDPGAINIVLGSGSNPLLLSLLSKRNIKILYTKSNPIIIDQNNVFEYLLKDKKNKPKYIDHEFLSAIYTITGIKNRGLKGLFGLSLYKTIMFYDMLAKRKLISKETNMKQICEIILQVKFDIKDIQEIYTRYLLIEPSDMKLVVPREFEEFLSIKDESFIDERELFEDANNTILKGSQKINYNELYKDKVKKIKWG